MREGGPGELESFFVEPATKQWAAHFFTDVTEFLATCGAVFFVPAEIMHDALTPEMRG
jgi:hypothetical protein